MSEFNGVLGVDDDSLDFQKPAKSSLDDITRYGKKMKCMSDPNDLKMWGNYNTPETRNFMIIFDKCNNETSPVPCKSRSFDKYQNLVIFSSIGVVLM